MKSYGDKEWLRLLSFLNSSIKEGRPMNQIQYNKLCECNDCSAFGCLCEGRVFKSDKKRRSSEF